MKNIYRISLLLPLVLLAACGRREGCDCKTDICLNYAQAADTPVTLVGTISPVNTTDADDKPYHPYVLTLPNQLCVAGDSNADPSDPVSQDAGPTRQLELAGIGLPQKLIEQTIGRTVEVSGKLFGASSGYHITPVLIDVVGVALVSPSQP